MSIEKECEILNSKIDFIDEQSIESIEGLEIEKVVYQFQTLQIKFTDGTFLELDFDNDFNSRLTQNELISFGYVDYFNENKQENKK